MKNFFQKNDENTSELFRKIEHACEGLIYISETDEPVMPFAGGRAASVTAEIILQQINAEAESRFEERDLDDLFGRLTTMRDWYGEREKARAKKFLELKTLLEENLRDLKVFRFGSIRLDIFAVGIDKDGNLVGVTTKAVET